MGRKGEVVLCRLCKKKPETLEHVCLCRVAKKEIRQDIVREMERKDLGENEKQVGEKLTIGLEGGLDECLCRYTRKFQKRARGKQERK